MGRRGPGAKPNNLHGQSGLFDQGMLEADNAPSWSAEGLSRPERVITFLESLTVTAGMFAGEKFSVRPWQREIIEGIYGPVDDNGRRLVRTALLTMPRKNGKTGLVAGLVLVHMFGPEAEARGQIFSAAVDRDQSALIFNECVAMIDADSRLSLRASIQSFRRTITDEQTGSVYQSLSSDAKKAHGLSPTLWIYDELAQVPGRHLLDALQTATGARAEPLGVVISTQSADPNHPMSEIVDYAQKVITGVLDDPTFFGRIYTAPDDADPWDEATWYACNPALDDFRSLEEMRTAATRAQRMPSFEPTFRNLYLNQRIDAESRFVNATEWEACATPVDTKALAGRPCFGGLDLGAMRDLSALILVFPDDDGGFDILPHFWLPGDVLREREDEDKVPYFLWKQQGILETTPGQSTDYRFITHRLGELAEIYDIQTVAFDRWRMDVLARDMTDANVTVPLEPFGQGFASMSPAIDVFEALLLEGKLRHGGHPLLRWNAANAVVVNDPAGNRKLDKAKSIARIDGLVALVMALGVAKSMQPETAPSCLTQGPVVVSF